jgi:hypothetical protein
MVSIKIDAVTRLDRSFLGINVQYIKSSKILLRTLGLAELKEKHTGMYVHMVNAVLHILLREILIVSFIMCNRNLQEHI